MMDRERKDELPQMQVKNSRKKQKNNDIIAGDGRWKFFWITINLVFFFYPSWLSPIIDVFTTTFNWKIWLLNVENVILFWWYNAKMIKQKKAQSY